MDVDDILHPQTLDILLAVIKNKEAHAVYLVREGFYEKWQVHSVEKRVLDSKLSIIDKGIECIYLIPGIDSSMMFRVFYIIKKRFFE